MTPPRTEQGTAERALGATRTWTFVVIVMAAFAAAEAWLVATRAYVHDEGMLTWLYASYLQRDPIATAFFLKAKPVLAAINAPGSAFGLTGFYVGHVVSACAGIVATAAAARAAKIREWGLAALVFACSPMAIAGTAAGFSNVDAAALSAIAIWLALRDRPGLGAGAMLSVLPWVRFESAVLVVSVAIAVFARDRNWRFAAGLVAFPIAYLAAGAAWHRDALWAIHYPAAYTYTPTGVHAAVAADVARATPIDLAYAVTTVTPLLALAFARVRAIPRWAQVGQASLALFLIAIFTLPKLGVAMGYSQRYLLQALPVAALLVAEQLAHAPRLAIAAFGTIGAWLGATLFARAYDAAAAFAFAAIAASIAFAVVARSSRIAALGAMAFAIAWPLASPPLDVVQPSRRAAIARVLEWAREHPAETAATSVVVTNFKLLDAALARGAWHPEVRCLVQTDSEHELRALTDPNNGQRDRIFALVAWRFYGRGVLAREVAANPGPPGSLVVIDEDPRLGDLRADTLERRGAEVLLRSPGVSILRLP